MSIEIGAHIPDVQLMAVTNEGPKEVSTKEIFAGKTVVLFAVPGAFTPTCHLNHLPGYLHNYEALKAKGVDEIAVVAVNDAFVMGAWAKDTDGLGKLTFLADGNGDFAKAMGLELDGSGFGMGLRSQRYALIAKDGVISALKIEASPGVAESSTAEAILEAL
ncbi:peroxiredoxin [Polycladidibacter stylochi]|uniref:peroxiredoxin n=1 Tax=Polycladidibacter stylochi TaxID=1807766 RepID=UPI00082FFD3A|nr:peroxiredoxin [Pseudovibrio stylochi]